MLPRECMKRVFDEVDVINNNCLKFVLPDLHSSTFS